MNDMLGRTPVLPTRWDEKLGLKAAYGSWSCRKEGWDWVWRGRTDQMDLKLVEEREKYELSGLGMPTASERMKLALLDTCKGNG